MTDTEDQPAFPLTRAAWQISLAMIVLAGAGAWIAGQLIQTPGAVPGVAAAAAVVWFATMLGLVGILPFARRGAYPLAMAQVVGVGVRVLGCIGGAAAMVRVFDLPAEVLMPAMAIMYPPVLMLESVLVVRYILELDAAKAEVAR